LEQSKKPNIELFIGYLETPGITPERLEGLSIKRPHLGERAKILMPPDFPRDPKNLEELQTGYIWGEQHVKRIDMDQFMMYLDSKLSQKDFNYNLLVSKPPKKRIRFKRISAEWEPNDKILYMFRGINKGAYIQKVIKSNHNYLYTDSGYLEYVPPIKEISPGGKKYRRVVYNGMHDLGTMKSDEIFKKTEKVISTDKLKNRFRLHVGSKFDSFKLNHGEKIKRGDKILFVVPSEKVIKWYAGIPSEKLEPGEQAAMRKTKGALKERWIKEFITDIKKYTDREIVIRDKPKILERRLNPLYNTLKTGDYHCVVTYNSIASIESVTMGIPCVCLGENAGSYLSETKLENIENPYFPEINKIRDHLLYLSCMQYTAQEIINGSWYDIFTAIKGEIKAKG
jgi:hypothetical protein